MSGRHEPGSSRSFYFSVATAGLRAVLVIAAVVLGVFVLSKAFPTGEAPTGGGVTVPTMTEEPQPTEEPTQEPSPGPPAQTQPCPKPRGITVQVLNGTNTTGLAAATAEDLKGLGYKIPAENVGNAQRNYTRTQIFFQQGFRRAAQCMRDEVFPTAKAERAPGNLDPNINLTVVVGEDVASAQ